MFRFLRRGTAVLERPPAMTARTEPTLGVTAERDTVLEAIGLIQQHVDKEATNRRVRELPIRDLCPMQKAELVKDLARALR